MTAQELLWEIALDRHGYVTTADARAVGVAPHTLKLLAQRGKLLREGHGLYRFERFPASAADEYQQAVLWTGQPDAALSHQTALDVLDLCDVNPDRIHVTVPATARVRRSGGDQIELHHQTLQPAAIGWWEGVRCVTEETAIDQTITGGTTPLHLIRQAIDTARSRGRINQEAAADFTSRMEFSRDE